MTRKDSGITKVADLKGKTVAVTKGTDPYFLLLQALKQEGISASDLTIQNLQHADYRTALDNGQVNAWSVWTRSWLPPRWKAATCSSTAT